MEWLVSGFRTKLTAAIVGSAIFMSSRLSSFGSEGNRISSCIMTRHSSHRITFRLLDMAIPLFRERWQTLVKCPKFLRRGHAEPLSESLVFCAFELEPSLQRLWRKDTRLLASYRAKLRWIYTVPLPTPYTRSEGVAFGDLFIARKLRN